MLPQNIPYGQVAGYVAREDPASYVDPQTRQIIAALYGQGYTPADFLASGNQQEIWSQLLQGAGQGAGNASKPPAPAPTGPSFSGLAPGTGPLLNSSLMSTPEIQKILGGLGTVNFGFPQRAVWGQ